MGWKYFSQMIQYGNIIQWPPWAERLTRWNHVMLVTNSSFNIVIYVFQVVFIFRIVSICKWYQMWSLIQFAIECLSASIKWKNDIQFFFSFIFVRTSNSVEPFGSTSCAWQVRPAKMPEEPGVQVFWCPFISLNWVGGSYDWIGISQWTLTTNDVAKFLI